MAKKPANTQALIFEDFKIQSIAFEIRHSQVNTTDNTTELINTVQSKLDHPLELVDSDQGLVFSYNVKSEIKLLPDRFAVISVYPKKNIDELINISKILTEAALEIYEIEKINRVGLRPIYVRECKDGKEVAALMYQSRYFNVPENLYLTNSGNPIIPSFSVGWESKEKGIVYRLKGESGRLTVNLPKLLAASGEFPPQIQKVYNQVILDVDLYLHKPVLPGQFFAEEWIRGAFETINNEGNIFFGSEK